MAFGPHTGRWNQSFDFPRDPAPVVERQSGEPFLSETPHAGPPPGDFIFELRIRESLLNGCVCFGGKGTRGRGKSSQLLPKIRRGLERLYAQPLHSLVALSEHEGLAALLQGTHIAFENRVATRPGTDGELLAFGHHPYAGGQPDKVVCISEGIAFVEIVDAPAKPAFNIAPGSETSHMKIGHRQHFGRFGQFAAKLRPELSPAVERAANEHKRVFAHLFMLQAYVGLDYRTTRPHPCFVALCGLADVHAASCLNTGRPDPRRTVTARHPRCVLIAAL